MDGEEPNAPGNPFTKKSSVDFEFPSLYEKLTGRENLSFFASLYAGHRDIDALLTQIGLHLDADKRSASIPRA